VACVSEGGSATVPADQRHRAVVLPNGVDPGRVEAKVGRAEQRSRWGVPPSAPLIGNVARISPEKGTAAFVEALACLPPDWHGVWVGPTNGVEEARDAMARLPDRLGVAGRLHLPGPTEDVGSALGAIDVFLTPSLEDAHPLGSIEAMMAGVPIVTSATGMAVERPDLFRVVRRGATGAELARAVLADAGDVDGTSRRVASARSHALAHYSRSAFLARWAALFDGLGLRAPKAGKAAPPSPWDRLDHAGRERVRLCPLRKEEWDGCCPLDRCHGPKSPHRGRRVQSIDCIECVLADGDR
jgi:glycosyltransferase involved in cell wall biosynthesis